MRPRRGGASLSSLVRCRPGGVRPRSPRFWLCSLAGPLLRCGRVCWLWPACYAWRSHRVPSLTWRSSRRPTCATVRPAAAAAATPAGAPQRTPPRAEPLPLHEVLSKDLPLCCAPQALRTHGTIRSTTPSTRCVPFIHRAALSDSLRRDQPSLHREPDRRGWLACWLAGLLAGF